MSTKRSKNILTIPSNLLIPSLQTITNDSPLTPTVHSEVHFEGSLGIFYLQFPPNSPTNVLLPIKERRAIPLIQVCLEGTGHLGLKNALRTL